MDLSRARTIGLVGTAVALLGYLIGTQVAYPGRAFSLTLGMVSIALLAVGGAGGTSG
jgi:hypothetical protein